MEGLDFKNLPSLKLSFKKTVFNTIDNKTQCFITCVLSLDGLTLLSDNFIKRLCKTNKMSVINGRNAVRFTSVGQSICHKDDNFDSSVGLHIAEAKAKNNAYQKSLGILVDIYDMIERDKMIICNACSNYGYLTSRERNHIVKLTK